MLSFFFHYHPNRACVCCHIPHSPYGPGIETCRPRVLLWEIAKYNLAQWRRQGGKRSVPLAPNKNDRNASAKHFYDWRQIFLPRSSWLAILSDAFAGVVGETATSRSTSFEHMGLYLEPRSTGGLVDGLSAAQMGPVDVSRATTKGTKT